MKTLTRILGLVYREWTSQAYKTHLHQTCTRFTDQ